MVKNNKTVGDTRKMKILSFQEKKRRKIEENLEMFQEQFWEWVFTHRWRPCRECTAELVRHWGTESLWHKLCGVCCSYFYYYQVLYVRAIKTVCQRGNKVPTFHELEEWYFNQDSY